MAILKFIKRIDPFLNPGEDMEYPNKFPTHRHPPEFWEELGRCIATFGCLEYALFQACFLLTGNKVFPLETHSFEVMKEKLSEWESEVGKALSDPLRPLINKFEKAIRDYPNAKTDGLEELLDHLKEGVDIRNMLCHSFWPSPDRKGFTKPFYFKRDFEYFDTPVNLAFLRQTRQHTTELIRLVLIMVASNGLELPGTGNPLQDIL